LTEKARRSSTTPRRKGPKRPTLEQEASERGPRATMVAMEPAIEPLLESSLWTDPQPEEVGCLRNRRIVDRERSHRVDA